MKVSSKHGPTLWGDKNLLPKVHFAKFKTRKALYVQRNFVARSRYIDTSSAVVTSR